MDIQVLMFGPRRCGKSSALAAMIDQFDEISQSADHEISIVPDADTKGLLANKSRGLKEIFLEHTDPDEIWIIDEDPSAVPYEYAFDLIIRGSENQYRIIFKDFPGEWLMEPGRQREVESFLKKSQAVLIAVDTPHLLEDGGAYSSSFNITEQVTNFLLNLDSEKEQARLLLFVPLKCEKYYHEGRMEEVNGQIKKQYETLLKSIESDEIKRATYTIAITPILTLGGVVFHDFGRDEDGNVDRITTISLSRSLFKRPKYAYYKLYEAAPYYAPEFCSQPVLYLLNYILKNAEVLRQDQKAKKQEKQTKKKRKGISSWLQKGFTALIVVTLWPVIVWSLVSGEAWKILRKILKDRFFIAGVQKTYGRLKTSGDGYELIQDPLKLGA